MALRPGETPKQYMRRMSRPPRPWWRRALSRIGDVLDLAEGLWAIGALVVLLIGGAVALYHWFAG